MPLLGCHTRDDGPVPLSRRCHAPAVTTLLRPNRQASSPAKGMRPRSGISYVTTTSGGCHAVVTVPTAVAERANGKEVKGDKRVTKGRG